MTYYPPYVGWDAKLLAIWLLRGTTRMLFRYGDGEEMWEEWQHDCTCDECSVPERDRGPGSGGV